MKYLTVLVSLIQTHFFPKSLEEGIDILGRKGKMYFSAWVCPADSLPECHPSIGLASLQFPAAMRPEQASLCRMLQRGLLTTGAHRGTGPVLLAAHALQSSSPRVKNSQNIELQGPSGDSSSPTLL